MDFELETIFLVVLAFMVGAALGFFLRRRSRRRASPLADTILLHLEETASPPPAEAPSAALPEPGPPVQAERFPLTPEAPTAPEPPAVPQPPTAPELPAAPKPARRRPAVTEAPATHPGHAPVALEAPNGEPDDLKRLRGIGPQNERRLNGFGIFHFAQIAAWTPEEAQWMGAALGFPGRVEREDWIGQARALMGEGGMPPAAAAIMPEEPDEAPLFPELDAAPPPARPRRRR